ncbi:AAA family ATPase [Saccharothrix australiensis]|uniref:MoxR-like ATPase n=1 Tax=Saccharothrix australiensis TaxID=2072 RepID=A0A495W2P8_9PSEU|nr:MoxR family ATPase [Saccharothrix australiensis]RKT55400.1 MoxR-like ATPase [Saccharothrix australiensis]
MTVSSTVDTPDRDGAVYLMTDELEHAVRIALATGRPLLLRGDPGSGKSSLAPFLARQEGWRFYKHVVTARTQAQDLLWTFDSVRRLGDAQRPEGQRGKWHEHRYIDPGPLWWAFAPRSAALRGSRPEHGMPERHRAVDKGNPSPRYPDHAVLLIDEIDKADPDLPNGLLVPLGSGEFHVTEIDRTIVKEPPATDVELPGTAFTAPGLARHLVVVTTNEERELPRAFLRRCVVAWLPEPDPRRLVDIARAHHGAGRADEELAGDLARALDAARGKARDSGQRQPSTAEFLDAYRACVRLGIRRDTPTWEELLRLTLLKPDHVR